MYTRCNLDYFYLHYISCYLVLTTHILSDIITEYIYYLEKNIEKDTEFR